MQTLTHILSAQVDAIGKAKVSSVLPLLQVIAAQNKLHLNKDLNKCRYLLEKSILNN